MADRIFKAMADATRRRIIQVLLRTELGVSELVEVLRLPQSTVSRHLKILRDAALVRTRNQGAATIYSPTSDQTEISDVGRMLSLVADRDLPGTVTARLDEVVRRRRSESDAFFAKVANRWDRMRLDCFGPSFHLEALTSLLPREWIVADVGTGTGYLLPILSASFKRVIAVDPVAEMLTAARTRADRLRNVELLAGAATALPIDTQGIDLCIASLVLHHEPNPDQAIREFHRVLRPGGTLLILEEATHHLTEYHEMMQNRWWGFDQDELRQHLTQAGFADLYVRTLATTEPAAGSAPQPPDLFVITGRKTTTEVTSN